MKLIFLIFSIFFISYAFSETRNYSFSRTEKMAGDVNSLEGTVTFSTQEKKELVSVDFIGNEKFNLDILLINLK